MDPLVDSIGEYKQHYRAEESRSTSHFWFILMARLESFHGYLWSASSEAWAAPCNAPRRPGALISDL